MRANIDADFWVELEDATVCQEGRSGKFTAKDFAFPWKSRTISLVPAKRPVVHGSVFAARQLS
jgi:hypothetical protein